MARDRRCLLVLMALLLTAFGSWPVRAANDDADDSGAPAGRDDAYARRVQADKPALYWSFEGGSLRPVAAGDDAVPAGRSVGHVGLRQDGPRPEKYPLFSGRNEAAAFYGDGGSIRVADNGPDSPLDFGPGEPITIEAWVAPQSLGNGQQMYIVGKGRTGNPGARADNQNYALRLTGAGGEARLSFLFRSAATSKGERSEFHRWDSTTGFAAGDGWHHVAVSYIFGTPESIRGSIDGRPVTGTWSYGGPTRKGPVVDDDELWIGSSMKASPGSTFRGAIDEIALYHAILPPERFAARYEVVLPRPYVTDRKLVPDNGVLVEILEGVPDRYSWDYIPPAPAERYTEPALALVEVPQKYNEHGVRADRSNPFVLWATTRLDLPAGEHRLLLRSRGGSRLFLGDKLIAEVPFPPKRSDGHNEVYDVVSAVSPAIRPLQPGDRETVVTISSPGGVQSLRLEVFVGGLRRRPELGETFVAIAPPQGDDFRLLGPVRDVPITEDGWLTFAAERHAAVARQNQQRRADASADWTAYWDQRHEQARAHVQNTPAPPLPEVPSSLPVQNAIDRYIGRTLHERKIEPTPLTDDWSFLRRVALDTIGTLPPADLVESFLNDRSPQRRAHLIDALLERPGWADHWVGYWQDVLAENPNIVNPTLNNTGPFRWWLEESFRDNKPFDRMATELILMEGSTYFGGPAGFKMATQNDVPMAAKAHIIAQAFLAVNMRCARCHDAPFHDVTQKDLFQLAAMLGRLPQTVPKTSTVPGGGAKSQIITVTLKPGQTIQPAWPFDEFGGKLPSTAKPKDDLRAELAARITAPSNTRFAQVIVNRMWRRYLGRGLVEPVDDWETAEPSHPELLDFLARELMTHDYDLKHVARLIFNSHVYQRTPDAAAADDAERAALFAGPLHRRMTAEQLVDSLYAAAGKSLDTEPLNIDVDGNRPFSSSLNLGVPRRAWQFTSPSNERDRPSLSLPAAQTVITLLETFGWRSSRQDPLTVREQEPTVLQPALLANGIAAKRITQLSEGSTLTELALRDQPLDAFIDAVYRRILNRPPRADERQLFTDLLRDGYAERIIADATPGPRPGPPPETGVSWTNHLKPEANQRKVVLAHRIERGDPPTTRLTTDWRQRAEDMVWALINSPEFVFVP